MPARHFLLTKVSKENKNPFSFKELASNVRYLFFTPFSAKAESDYEHNELALENLFLVN
jgi:hypothetical protein